MLTFVLVHSPLVGPGTWAPLADELARRGFEVLVPDLGRPEAGSEPFWLRHARAAAAALADVPPDRVAVLAGHSAAGLLLPAIREAARRPVAAYLFVDAHPPREGGQRPAEGEFRDILRRLYESGGAFPDWTDEDLRELVPDAERRRRLVAELRPPPWPYWEETIPAFSGWPDAPCGFLRFTPNPAYDEAAEDAAQRRWPSRELAGGHFHMLAGPAGVTEALLELTTALVPTVNPPRPGRRG
jgi:hypothetical protein